MLKKCLCPQCGRNFFNLTISGAFFYKNGTLSLFGLFFKNAKTAIFVIFRVFSSFFTKFHQKWPFLKSCSKVLIAPIPFSSKMDKKRSFCKKCFSNTFLSRNDFREFLEFEKVKKWQKVSFLLFFAKNDKNELVVFLRILSHFETKMSFFETVFHNVLFAIFTDSEVWAMLSKSLILRLLATKMIRN